MLRTAIAWLAVSLSAAAWCRGQDRRGELEYRWVYVAKNLLVRENVAAVQGIMRRAAAAGYNGLCLADYKLQILDSMPAEYFRNLDEVKATAAELGLAIYPSVFQVGYAGGILSHDPNLVEGQPVRDALFVARADGTAELVPDPAVAIGNGDFETVKGHTLAGFFLQDSPGASTWSDTRVVRGGGRSLRMERIGGVNPQHGNCRVAQTVKVSPWRQYHLSAWIKTDGFDRAGNIRIQALAAGTGERLSSTDLDVKPTQDWRQYHVVFNSQEHTSVNVYFGVWGGNKGTLWWDDAAIEEVGLLNVIHRPGAPVSVRAEEGGTVYKPRRDYEPPRDPRMGMVPWPGGYDVYHAVPAMRLMPGSRIKEGERLRVSFTHAITTERDKVALCVSEPASMELLRAEADAVVRAVRPRGLFMAHDEIRVMNWCGACAARGVTPGQLLADNIRRCTEICRERLGPGGEVFVWSDMFDPAHNAVDGYYLVNGSLAGSWEGLDPGVVILNWNSGEAGRSLAFFAGRGHRQILAGYYDAPVGRITGWLKAAREVGAPIAGVMYTTWADDYARLEDFAKAAWGP